MPTEPRKERKLTETERNRRFTEDELKELSPDKFSKLLITKHVDFKHHVD